MAYWLFKQEPSSYSYSNLETETNTTWDGITNNLALKNLRSAKRGDMAFFYHTGQEKQIVGIMEILTDAYPDPRNKSLSLVDVRPIRRLTKSVTLSQIRTDRTFSDWELLRLPRLSVMPVSPKLWTRILQMAGD